MKIKQDFVTNSSSTCYIVLITNDFELETDQILSEIDNLNKLMIEQAIPIEKLIHETKEAFDKLKDGFTIWKHGTFNGQVYNVVQQICKRKNLVLSYFDVSSDSNDFIVPVSQKRIVEVLFNQLDLHKTIKICEEGVNVTSKD